MKQNIRVGAERRPPRLAATSSASNFNVDGLLGHASAQPGLVPCKAVKLNTLRQIKSA